MNRVLMLIAGFLAVAVIIFSCTSNFESELKAKEIAELAADQSEEFPQPVEQINVAAITIPSSLIINYTQLFPVLFELLLSDEVPDMPELPFEIKSAKLIKYLFRVIISPNAP